MTSNTVDDKTHFTIEVSDISVAFLISPVAFQYIFSGEDLISEIIFERSSGKIKYPSKKFSWGKRKSNLFEFN